jgi:hypothetical protein
LQRFDLFHGVLSGKYNYKKGLPVFGFEFTIKIYDLLFRGDGK